MSERRTPIQFVVETTKYVSGIGHKTETEFIKSIVGFNEDKPIYSNVYYVNWQDSYGSQNIMLEQQNVIQPAKVVMTYVKEVSDALKTKNVIIYLNCDPTQKFKLNSTVANFKMQNKTLEFQVKRIEVK